MQQHGWTLLFHDNLIEQMMKLRAAVLRAQESDPGGLGSNANVRFFRTLIQLLQGGGRSIRPAANTVKATPWGQLIATGGPTLEGGAGCFSVTSPG
jgi:hypothetical protein